MNKHRKKIILSEIEYWKRNKLLPEQYCDFLSALYTGGNDLNQGDIQASSSILHKEKRKQLFLISSVILFSLLIALLIVYIDDKLSLFFGIIGIGFLISLRTIKSDKIEMLNPFIYISSAFILLMITFKVWSLYFIEQPMVLVAFLAVNCIIWFFVGRFLKLLYFTLSGVLGSIAIIVFLIFKF